MSGEAAPPAVAGAIDDPSLCVVGAAAGGRMPPALAALLRPVDPATFHLFRLPANAQVELHYHDVDEYWWFVAGRPRVVLRAPNGVRGEFDLGPGDLVACVRGVEHTLRADHELVYAQFSSVPAGGERRGHLTRPTS